MSVDGLVDIKANATTGSLLVEVTSGNPGGSGTSDTLETSLTSLFRKLSLCLVLSHYLLSLVE